MSHTKDGFRWDENEQPFLELLRDFLDDGDVPLLRQAEGYRAREAAARIMTAANQAVTNTSEVMERNLPDSLPAVAEAGQVDTPAEEVPARSLLAGREFEIRFRDANWLIKVELTNDPAESQWLVISDSRKHPNQPRKLTIRVSLAHPFMVRFAQTSTEDVEGLLRVAAAVALAEILARDAGVRKAGTVRRNVNDILRDALSDP